MPFPGEVLLRQIDERIEKRHLLKHPFYQDWQAGKLTRGALQLYAAQYYRHVKAFPAYLRMLAARADDTLRGVVLQNLAEEENPRAPHPKLWRDFATSVGVSEETLDSCPALPGTQALVETYRRICAERSLAEAVAALYAYEAQVPEIATQKLDGLRRFYGITEPKGLAYFAVHEEADQAHRAAWSNWLSAECTGDTEDVLGTADEALEVLWGALDAVHRPCA